MSETAQLVRSQYGQVQQGVPLYTPPGVPPVVATGSTVVLATQDPFEDNEDDLIPAFLATGCFGLFGFCCYLCNCNSPTGRVGASAGCIFNCTGFVVVHIIILILFVQDDCQHPNPYDYSDHAACNTWAGNSLATLIAGLIIAALGLCVSIIFCIKFGNDRKRDRAVIQV